MADSLLVEPSGDRTETVYTEQQQQQQPLLSQYNTVSIQSVASDRKEGKKTMAHGK